MPQVELQGEFRRGLDGLWAPAQRLSQALRKRLFFIQFSHGRERIADQAILENRRLLKTTDWFKVGSRFRLWQGSSHWLMSARA
jgi:hypothetical protein